MNPRVCNREIAKEIWKVLEATHEGTNQVKESNINLLTHHYKLLKLENNEKYKRYY